MGGKRTPSRVHVYVCVALLTCVTLCSCSVFQKLALLDEPRQRLDQGRKSFALNDFDRSLEENQKVLLLTPDRPPGDEALFNIGLIYAYPGNPKRDPTRSIAYFERLIRDFPESPWSDKARTCIEMVRDFEKTKQALAEADQDKAKTLGENEKLKKALAQAAEENERSKQALSASAQENARLKNTIDEWKRIDMELEQKKRGRVR